MKTKLFAALGVAIVFCSGLMIGAGVNKFATPSTILHVITIKWKAAATPEQRKAAIDGIKTMAGQVPLPDQLESLYNRNVGTTRLLLAFLGEPTSCPPP